MEFVLIGNPGNKNDSVYRFGHVPYVYEIAKYSITNEEYADFLNAVAKFHDPYNLYSVSMSTGLFGGIDRLDKGEFYIYQAKKDWGKRPVVYVSWYDLARMANWLHHGQPRTGRSKLGTTEGTSSRGAYNTRYFPEQPVDSVNYQKLPITRNSQALYWLPSEDEWYKAAYHDPTRSVDRQYWHYAVKSDQIPNNAAAPGDQYSSNFFSEVFSVGKPYFLTEVDAYPSASSYYGTYDQGGNVWEWLESWRLSDRGQEQVRGLRGSSATYSEIGLHAANTDPGNPSHKKFVWGGRIARAHTADSGKIIYSDTCHIRRCWHTKRLKLKLSQKVKTLKKTLQTSLQLTQQPGVL